MIKAYAHNSIKTVYVLKENNYNFEQQMHARMLMLMAVNGRIYKLRVTVCNLWSDPSHVIICICAVSNSYILGLWNYKNKTPEWILRLKKGQVTDDLGEGSIFTHFMHMNVKLL